MRPHPPLRTVAALALLGCLFVGALSLAGRARLDRADFAFNNGSEVATLDPAHSLGILEGRVIRCLYEGLVIKHPKTLEPIPGMARSWEQSPDGLRLTFHLREDAVWTNGDRVTAHDFVFSFERFLHPETAANYSHLLWYVRGARAFSTSVTAAGEAQHSFADSVGIRALDDFTLIIELERRAPFFLDLMAFYSPCPVNRRAIEEAKLRWGESWEVHWLAPEHIVTNGPFRLVDRRVNDRIRLAKFEDYWDADNVAFRTVDILAIEQESTLLNTYLTGSVDYIDRISTNVADEMMAREDFVPELYAGTYFYRVNVTQPPFDDLRVRRALSLTIPRERICQDIMKTGQVPAYGLVPPGIPDYLGPGARGLNASQQNQVEAKRLLAEAGYGPGGKPMPHIEIHYNTSEAHAAIAQVVALAWQNQLGLRAKLRNEEWKVYLDTQNNRRYDVSRSSWIADYVDPSTFIEQFVSDGDNNRTGWSNPDYDRLVAAASQELDLPERLRLLSQAEAVLIDELPILPVYHYVSQNAVAPRLGGFHGNYLDDHFIKHWYWMDDEELAIRRANQDPGLQLVDPHGPAEGLYPPSHPKYRPL